MQNEMSMTMINNYSNTLKKAIYTYANYEELQKSEHSKATLKDKKNYGAKIIHILGMLLSGEYVENGKISNEDSELLSKLTNSFKGRPWEEISYFVDGIIYCDGGAIEKIKVLDILDDAN